MAEEPTMRVRIVADTTQFERDIERTTEKVKREQKKVQPDTQRSTAAIQAAGTVGAAGITTAGALATSGIGQAVLGRRFFGRAIGGRVGGMAGGRILGSMMGLMGGPLGMLAGGLAGGYLGSKLFGGGNRGGRANNATKQLSEQTEILKQLLQTSAKSGETLQTIQVLGSLRAGLGGESRAAAEARMRAAGTLVTDRQGNISRFEMDAQRRVNEARAALGRSNRGLFGYVPGLMTQAKGFGYESLNTIRRAGMGGFEALEGLNTTQRSVGYLPALANTILGGMAVGPRPSQIIDMFGGPRGPGFVDPNTTGPLGGLDARQLAFQRQRGPAQILQGSATVNSGADRYAFAYQRQRETMQRQETQEWQKRVLMALEVMAENGKASEADVWMQKLRMGLIESV